MNIGQQLQNFGPVHNQTRITGARRDISNEQLILHNLILSNQNISVPPPAANNSPNAAARRARSIVVPATDVDIEEPGVVEVRPKKLRRKTAKRGTRRWSREMDLELMKCWNMIGLYNHLAHGEKGPKQDRLVTSFAVDSTTAVKGCKIRALKSRMILIMNETACWIKCDSHTTGGGDISDDKPPMDSEMDSQISAWLQQFEEYARLAKDLLAQKEVRLLFFCTHLMLIVLVVKTGPG